MELTPKLDETSGVALYEQIYGHIRSEIASGNISPYAKLPSIRHLSRYLGISRMPVELAYQQLIAEGYVVSKPRSGLFAAEVAPSLGSESAEAGRAPRSATPESASSCSARAPIAPALPDSAQLEPFMPAIRFDFGYGNTDLEHFPFQKWRRLMNRSFWPENRRLFRYGDLQGEPELRVEIASYLHQVRGVRCTPDHIVVGAGTYHSLDLLCQLLKPDVSRLALEAAVNDGVRATFEQHRFALAPIPLEADGIDTARVAASDAQAVYVTPSHQFPYGMILPIGKRQALLHWAEQTGGYIVENDYDGEFRYYGKPIPSLQGMDATGERVVYIGTFSKALTPSFRISYLVLPERLLARYRSGQHSYDQLASPILQNTLQLFMQSGDFERHMRKMRRLYEKKHAALVQTIRKEFADAADIVGDGSGLHVLLRVRAEHDESALIRLAEEVGIRVYPTSVYELEAGTAGAPTVLLGFGGLPADSIAEGIAELKRVWLSVDST